MASQNELNEATILHLLWEERSIKLEHLVALLPQLSWNQVFQGVDSLSRRGDIILLRRGFDYEIVWASARAHAVSCPACPAEESSALAL